MNAMDALASFLSGSSSALQGTRNHHHAHGVKKADDDQQNNAATPPQAPALTQQYALAENAGDKRSFELNIKTKEGDTVKIKVDAEQVNSLIAAKQTDQNGTVAAAQYTEKKSLQFSYSVDGNLNEDELKAIDSLFSDANKLASSFYNGNVEDAFKQAKSLNFDNSEIASFSLSLSENQSYSKTQAYQQVQNQLPEATPPTGSTTTDSAGNVIPIPASKVPVTAVPTAVNPNDLFRKLGKFLFDAAKFIEQNSQNADSKNQVKDILKQLPSDDSVKFSWEQFLADAFKHAA